MVRCCRLHMACRTGDFGDYVSVKEVAELVIWIAAIERVKRCEEVIALYEGLGLSGTAHDLEHRRMLDDAIAVEAELRK